jgi:hypothetical protein
MKTKLAYSQPALANLLKHLLSSRLLRLPLFHLLTILHSCPYYVLISSVGDPDPDLFDGSGNFDPTLIRPPKGAYYQSEKVIFSQQHFQYRVLKLFSKPQKNLSTFGQTYLKHRHFKLFPKSGGFYS